MAAQPPQPDFNAIGQAHSTLGVQYPLLLAPIVQMQQLPDTVNAIQDTVNAIQVTTNAMQVDIQQLRASLDAEIALRPMRQFNQSCSDSAPLRYPNHYLAMADPDPRPATKPALQNLAYPNCLLVAEGLGLPPLPAGTPVRVRKEQISDYLGCAMEFN